MLVAIHQPEHLPWIGYFEKMLRADIFVLLDDVQFSQGDFHNRTRIKGVAGPQWLTVPVVHRFPQAINEVNICDGNWQTKHWKSLESCYGKAKHFSALADSFENLCRKSWSKLLDFNMAALELIALSLDIEKRWILSSQLQVSGQKSDLVLNICKRLGASAYYSGKTGSAYLDRPSFQAAGIEIRVQKFRHPVYEQLFMKESGFVDYLSAVDILFNCGPQSRELLRASGTL